MATHQPVRDWIDAVCRQYSRITGHVLHFEAADVDQHRVRPGYADEPREQWRATLCDGTRTVGVLRLNLPAGHTRDADYLGACDTAEMTAQLIERVLSLHAGDSAFADEVPPTHPNRRSVDQRHTFQAGSGLTNHPETSTAIERLLDVLLRVTDFPVAAFVIFRGNDFGRHLWAMKSSGVLMLSSAELGRCHEHLIGRTGPDSARRILRRCLDPEECRALLPKGVATGIAHTVGQNDDVHGVLWLFDRRDRRLTARDHQTIESVSARLARLLEQVTLFDHRSHSRRVRAEMKIASQSQPSSEIEFPGAEGWCELAGRMQSEGEIGGDLLEVIPFADERLFLAIGDAAGHSIPAAMVMANVRGAIRALFDSARHESDRPSEFLPQQILTRVNKVLYDIVHARQFMTLCCGNLNRRTLTFEYANAGHPPPLLVRGDAIRPLEARGLVLGVMQEVAYEPIVVSLQPRDVLVFYTDGVTEAVSQNNSLFALQGALQTAMRRAGTAVDLRDQLWSSLQQHLAGGLHHDDRTLAVLRINRP
jgi:sigma-B regulation protein RsbU (phosphoserine phosphatase)